MSDILKEILKFGYVGWGSLLCRGRGGAITRGLTETDLRRGLITTGYYVSRIPSIQYKLLYTKHAVTAKTVKL